MCLFFIFLLLLLYTILFPYTTLFRSSYAKWGKLAMKETKQKYPDAQIIDYLHRGRQKRGDAMVEMFKLWLRGENRELDRKSTRLNSSHVAISYAVFCLKKKIKISTTS